MDRYESNNGGKECFFNSTAFLETVGFNAVPRPGE